MVDLTKSDELSEDEGFKVISSEEEENDFSDVSEANREAAILVLDEYSRNVIKSNISVIGLEGIRFIDSLDEMSEELVQYSNRVFILEGFMQRPACLSELRLFKAVYQLEYFYLGSSKYFNVMNSLAHCFECNLVSLDYQILVAALYGDSTQELKGSADYFDKMSYADKILEADDYPVEAIELATSYKAIGSIFNTIMQEKDELKKEVSDLSAENVKLRNDSQRLLQGYKNMIKEAKGLNKTLRRYEQIFTNDIYEKIRLTDYVNKPFVMYFKEYEDFINLDEFFETLFSVLKLQDRKSVKVIRLFDSVTSRKLLTVPEYYTILTNKYRLADIVGSDFICKTGDYRKLFDKILMNETGLDILIVIDSKSLDDTILSEAALYLNLCREVSHLEAFGLYSGNTIVNSGDRESDFYWGRYNTEGMNNREKMIYLSSRPVIRNVLELSRAFAQSL